MKTMKAFIKDTFKLAIAVLFVLGTLAVQASAQEYEVDGLAQPATYFRTVPHQVFPHHRYGTICRDFVVVERRHGHYREVVKTVCRDRHLRHFRGDHRHHFYGDYRHHFRNDDRKHFRGDRRHHWKGGQRRHRW